MKGKIKEIYFYIDIYLYKYIKLIHSIMDTYPNKVYNGSKLIFFYKYIFILIYTKQHVNREAHNVNNGSVT